MKKLICLSLVAAALLFTAACSESGPSAETEEAKMPPAAPAAPSETPSPYKGGMTKEQRQSDAQLIISLFERNYAPRDLKENFLKLNFAEHAKKFYEDAGSTLTDIEFYDLVIRFIAKFQDSHTSVTIPSSATSSLPFSTDYIDGKVIIIDVDKDADDMKGKISAGDELISIDGEPVMTIAEKLREYIGSGTPEGTLRRAAGMLPLRSQKRLPNIPEGKCMVVVKSHKDGSENSFELEWKLEGSKLSEMNDPGVSLSKALAQSQFAQSTTNILEKLRTKYEESGSEHLLSRTIKPFFDLGKGFIQRKDNPFVTGILSIEGKKVGFIRISDFSPDDPRANISALEEEISYMQENTEALIVDEAGNPGGSYCYMLSIASMLGGKEFKETPDQFKINRDLLIGIEEELKGQLEPNDKKILEAIAESIRDGMKKGALLTDPRPICNADGSVQLHTAKNGAKIAYTKPILILMDELSASCGDYFPIAMKEMGRATLFGAQTAGAGGAVVGYGPRLGYSEIFLRLTISLGVRNVELEDQIFGKTRYIENVGAIPDIEYHVTQDDVARGFSGYKKAVEQAALSLIDEAGKEAK